MNKFFLLFTILLLLSSCGKSDECSGNRAFDHWLFQQTWFISQTPSTENIGAIFGDSTGSFYVPFEKKDFSYCAEGLNIYLHYDVFWRFTEKVEITSLNEEEMKLKFSNGTTYKYYRAGR